MGAFTRRRRLRSLLGDLIQILRPFSCQIALSDGREMQGKKKFFNFNLNSVTPSILWAIQSNLLLLALLPHCYNIIGSSEKRGESTGEGAPSRRLREKKKNFLFEKFIFLFPPAANVA